MDISYLLNAEATEATVSSSNKTKNADVVCSSCEQVKSEASDQQSDDTRRESVAKNDSHSKELSLEKACDCQIEIDELRKRIKDLEERREEEKFGVRRFMASDSDIRFYTRLPDYAAFIALYNFAKPKPGFSLNYYNGYTNASKEPSYSRDFKIRDATASRTRWLLNGLGLERRRLRGKSKVKILFSMQDDAAAKRSLSV